MKHPAEKLTTLAVLTEEIISVIKPHISVDENGESNFSGFKCNREEIKRLRLTTHKILREFERSGGW